LRPHRHRRGRHHLLSWQHLVAGWQSVVVVVEQAPVGLASLTCLGSMSSGSEKLPVSIVSMFSMLVSGTLETAGCGVAVVRSVERFRQEHLKQIAEIGQRRGLRHPTAFQSYQHQQAVFSSLPCAILPPARRSGWRPGPFLNFFSALTRLLLLRRLSILLACSSFIRAISFCSFSLCAWMRFSNSCNCSDVTFLYAAAVSFDLGSAFSSAELGVSSKPSQKATSRPHPSNHGMVKQVSEENILLILNAGVLSHQSSGRCRDMGRWVLSRAFGRRRTRRSLLSLMVEVAGKARVTNVSHRALLIHALVIPRHTRYSSTTRHTELRPLFAVVQHEVLAIQATLRLDPLTFGYLLARLMRQR
ncbi:hypothetical protein KCV00_g418, partial [Aureobasidium melanogenum]